MDLQDSLCPNLLSSEITAMGIDLGRSAGKEDSVEAAFSLLLLRGISGIEQGGGLGYH